MTISEIITENFPVLPADATVGLAISEIADGSAVAVPVADADRYVGMVESSDLFDADDDYAPVAAYVSQGYPTVAPQQHLVEAVSIMLARRVTVLPVVDAEGNFVGVVEQRRMSEAVGYLIGAREGTEIVEIALDAGSATLTRITSVVEDAGAELRSMMVSRPTPDGAALVTLCVGRGEGYAVQSSLARYGLNAMVFAANAHNADKLRHNYMSLMKYLDM